jgi:two-component system chemotaxis sensor kinase CheA
LQEEVMRIRMLPVANVFHKFPRLVRDLARQTGKEVELVIRGEDTELDRSVIETIGDPLIHMLRNAVDHGLETPAERREAGKPERGTATLTARHEEGRILLTVEDDGRGIDAERVKASAVRKGLIGQAEAAALTPAQVVDLIFTPGLSTAKTVSGLSGRGVGMDIVRANVERLNGSVSVETWPGRGTRFQVSLPLTLAIVPALLVQAGGFRGGAAPVFALPLSNVMEALQLEPHNLHTVNGQPMTMLRGRVLPLLKLDEALGFVRGREDGPESREYVVAVRWAQSTLGLRVDRLVGEQEVVIKSLGPLFGESAGLAGAAILGDGQIALIVDIPGLFKLSVARGRPAAELEGAR